MEEENVIEIKPASKWKRILLFLGDYFITFILAFIMFNMAVFPLSKVIFNTQKQSEEIVALEEKSNDLLVNAGFLYKNNPPTQSFEDYVSYTFKVFLSYYAFDEENVDTNNPQYGHKAENEVIRTFYINYLNDETRYLSLFNSVNEDGMFTIGDSANSIALKSDYKLLLGPELLEVKDEEKYSVNMVNVRDHVFAKLFYLNVYQHILDHDYVKDGESYNEYMNRISDIARNLQWIAVGDSLISCILCWGAVYLLYPMINKERRSPTMSAMRLDKLNIKTFNGISRSTVAIESFYHLILSLSMTLFLPILYFGFAYCFNLPILFIISIISLALTLASLFIILFNQYNRSGVDLLSNSVVLPTTEVDELYRKQYENGDRGNY